MPRIYVASLSDYNAGRLHGCWIDLDGLDANSVEDVQAEIAEMLRESRHPNVTVDCPKCGGAGWVFEETTDRSAVAQLPCPTCTGAGKVPSAEEWAVHDYDDLPGYFGEHPNLSELLEFIAMVEEHGDDWRAYLQHCEDIGADPSESHFEDCRAGSADSELEWCEQFLDDCGTLSQIPENLRSYFDTERYLRDMKLGGDVDFVDHDGTTYAFWRN